MGDMKKIVGLEGFCNSGKSSVLRIFAHRLLETGKILKSYDFSGVELNVSKVSWDEDFIAVIEYQGKTILVVTGGDYISTVGIVIKIIASIKINLDVVFVAMRKQYPAVGDEYRTQVRNLFSMKVKTVFKPGYKRFSELDKEEVAFADGLWVQELMKELGQNGESLL